MFEEKLKEIGIEIPEAPKPVAAYIPAVLDGKLIYTAGQLPFVSGELKYTGKLGKSISDEDAQKAAEICAINCLSVVKSVIGDINKIEKIIKLNVYVNSSDEFTSQPKIANGASELMVKIFGDAGKHARSAVGVSQLPLNAPVEIDMIIKVR